MFDADQKLVLCNRRYMDIYGISEHLAQPGVTLVEILRHRVDAGNVPDMDAEAYIENRLEDVRRQERNSQIHHLQNGRTIAVGHIPIDGGGWLTTHDDITELYSLQREVEHMAYHDHLTGLPNRRKLIETLDMAVEQDGNDNDITLFFLDLDGFKTVNDTLGHHAGDEVLRLVGKRLSQGVREDDLVARLGGDEFAIVQNPASRHAETVDFSRRIVSDLSNPYRISGKNVQLRASVGIATGRGQIASSAALLQQADLAMYRAKNDGGNAFEFYQRDCGQDAA